MSVFRAGEPSSEQACGDYNLRISLENFTVVAGAEWKNLGQRSCRHVCFKALKQDNPAAQSLEKITWEYHAAIFIRCLQVLKCVSSNKFNIKRNVFS